MLAKKNRLPKNEFKKVFKNGRRLHNKYFTLIYHANPMLKSPQAAVVVSKKVAKNAVDRNKIKRRIRAVIQEHIEKIQNHQVIVLTKPLIQKAAYQDIEVNLERMLGQSTPSQTR